MQSVGKHWYYWCRASKIILFHNNALLGSSLVDYIMISRYLIVIQMCNSISEMIKLMECNIWSWIELITPENCGSYLLRYHRTATPLMDYYHESIRDIPRRHTKGSHHRSEILRCHKKVPRTDFFSSCHIWNSNSCFRSMYSLNVSEQVK